MLKVMIIETQKKILLEIIKERRAVENTVEK